MNRLARAGVAAAGLLASVEALAAARGPAAPHPPASPEFARDVQPILAVSCVRCHSAALPQGKLRLDTREGVLQGGATGAALVPGDGRGSLLYQRLVLDDPQKRMPWLSDPLTPGQIDTVRRWIDAGAPRPEGGVVTMAAATPPSPAPPALPPAVAPTRGPPLPVPP